MSEFTHMKRPYCAECYQLKSIDDPLFLDFLTREGFEYEVNNEWLRVRHLLHPVKFLVVGAWVRKGENGIIKFFKNNEEFQLRYVRIAE